MLKIDRSIGRTRIFLCGKKIASIPNNFGKKIQRNIFNDYIRNCQNIQRSIVLFDCLYDKYAEAIDAFSFFKYLQKLGIPSTYILLRENKLSNNVEIDAYKGNIYFIDNQDELFIKHASILSNASYIITSFGLHNKYNKILKTLPSFKYVYIDHGVYFLKKWTINLYNNKRFDLILSPTKKTAEIYRNDSRISKNSIICSGFPRWDNLKRIPHKKKNILIFFTWRKSFENNKSDADRYKNRLNSFLTNKKLQTLVNRYDIALKLAIHHGVLYKGIQFQDYENINIIDTTKLSKEIVKTDLLITDYSGICFDFMYLDIPVIFYRFDSNISYSSTFDLNDLESCKEKDSYLYNCFYQGDDEQVIDKIESYIKNNFILEEENLQKNLSFFYHRDNKNCERLLNSLNLMCSESKISIIIPVYNTGQYLRKTLESLTNQTYKNIEILCIDDGSHDDSFSILEEYAKADSRMRVFRQENKGPAAARNLGLDNMTGEYLMFCDSDDWYEPDMCEKMLFAITSENVDVACCRTNLHFEKKDKRVRKKYFNNRNFSGKKKLDIYYIIKTNVLLWNKIFKTDIINKYKIRFPEGLHHEDDAFWYMYAICSKSIYYLPKKLYNYVVRAGSIMRNGSNQVVDSDRLGICSYLYQILKNNSLLQEKISALKRIFELQSKLTR